MRIVHIDEHLVSRAAKIVIQLSLGLLHALKTSETEQMSLADIGYETIVRQSYLHQLLDVARVARAHLHHSKLCLRVDAQQSQRHSDAVVQIALGRSHTIFHRQHLTDQFFCCSLSVGTGQSNDCQRLAIDNGHRPVPARQLLQSLQSVIHLHKTRIIGSGNGSRLVDHGISRAELQRLQRILVAVEVLALQSEEHLPALERTRVGGHDSALLEFIVY